MNIVSTRGRSLPGAQEVWAEDREPHGPYGGRTERHPEGSGREKIRRLRDYREAVDVGADAGVHRKTVPENSK